MMRNRKRRCDSTYLVYVITNTVTQQQYIGITVQNPGGIYKTLRRRIQKHVQRALAETKSWTLCQSIREHGPEAHTFGFLERVRGRASAYARERELIAIHQPQLNTF